MAFHARKEKEEEIVEKCGSCVVWEKMRGDKREILGLELELITFIYPPTHPIKFISFTHLSSQHPAREGEYVEQAR